MIILNISQEEVAKALVVEQKADLVVALEEALAVQMVQELFSAITNN